MSSTGQVVGGVAGAVAGFFIGGPTGAVYGAQLGMAAGGLLDPPKGQNQQGPRITDTSVQTATYGALIPRAYGTVALNGNVFWLEGDSIKETVNTEEAGGGKGGTPSTEITTYSYSATFAVGLCEGPIVGIGKLWIGPNLVYDSQSSDPEQVIASNANTGLFTLYTGADDQDPDPTIQADRGAANVSAYPGLAYLVIHDLQLAGYGNTLQAAQVRAEVIVNGSEVRGTELDKRDYRPVWYNAGDFEATPRYIGVEFCTFSQGDWGNDYPTEGNIFWTKNSPVAQDQVAQWFRDDLDSVINAVPPRGSVDQPEYYPNWIDIVDMIPGYDRSGSLGGSDGHFRLQDGRVWICRTIGVGAEIGISAVGASTGPIWSTVDYLNGVAPVDGSDECYTVSTDGYVRLFDATGTQLDSQYHATLVQATVTGQGRARVAEGYLWYIPQMSETPTRLYRISLDLQTVELYASLNISDLSHGYNGDFDIFNGTLVFAWTDWIAPLNNAVARIDLSMPTPAPTTLDEVVKAECLRSNLLSASDLDVTEISTTNVTGYRVTGAGSIRAALEPLQGAYPFDVVQSGYLIAFRQRGGASVASISADDLNARVGETEAGDSLVTMREQDTQLPSTISIMYLSTAREYDTGEQRAERLGTDSVHKVAIEMPVVLTATEAAQRADVLMSVYWIERQSVQFTVGPEFLNLEPSDVVTVTDAGGRIFEVRIMSAEYTSLGVIAIEGRLNSAAIYTSTAEGEDGDSVTAPVQYNGDTRLVLVDTQVMVEGMNAPGQLAVMLGYSESWPGATLFHSTDNGANWTSLTAATTAVNAGVMSEALAAPAVYEAVDTSASFSVRLPQAVSSITYAQLINNKNLFAIGAPGRWEIVGAKDVTVSNGVYTFSNLLRARFGSEFAAQSHIVGDAIVRLDDVFPAWASLALGTSWNVETLYRAVTAGRSLDSASDAPDTYEAANLKPLAPVNLNGTRKPDTGGGRDWQLAWTRRDRLGWALVDYVGTPLSESSESYDVEIYEDGTFTTVVRTFSTLTAATVDYESADQVSDFGSDQGTLYVRVYQNSASVGRGRALEATITRA